MSEWLGMDSAPTDGTVLLAYWRNTPVHIAWCDNEFVSYRREGFWPFSKKVAVSERETGWRVLMLRRDASFGIHGNFAPFTPVGWQPLPAPPAPDAFWESIQEQEGR